MSETKGNYLTELEQKQLQIINHYGIDKQYDQLIEECSELIQAICKYKRDDLLQSDNNIVTTANIIEEMADIENLIEQIKLKDKFIGVGVVKVKEHKVNRELERIKNRLKRG